MSKSDWLLVAFNTATLVMAAVGLASQHPDPMTFALVLALVATLVNSTVLIRRSGQAQPVRTPRQEALPEAETDLDARRILDIDARLDALERAEDRRLQMMAIEDTTPPPAPATGSGTNGRRMRS